MDWMSLYPFIESIKEACVSRGDTTQVYRCWIGIRSMIMLGVTIDEGAVVAAGAVVTQDFLPYAVVGENQAKECKF
ncbi:DapH/DapD/GlmU-related protein [Enterobacter asburiae]